MWGTSYIPGDYLEKHFLIHTGKFTKKKNKEIYDVFQVFQVWSKKIDSHHINLIYLNFRIWFLWFPSTSSSDTLVRLPSGPHPHRYPGYLWCPSRPCGCTLRRWIWCPPSPCGFPLRGWLWCSASPCTNYSSSNYKSSNPPSISNYI